MGSSTNLLIKSFLNGGVLPELHSSLPGFLEK